MKFLHLSDLHLGKVVRGFSMLEDQRYLLSQVVQAASDHQVDAVIIAGDVYDKHFPPEEAVQLLDDFLSELSRLRISILIIAGNHDSRVRLQFGSRLLRHQSLYIVSSLKEALEPIVLKDAYGEVNFYLLPYVNPAYVRAFLQQEVKTYQESVDLMIRAMHIDTSKRNVLAAHQFVSGAQTCDSESSLSSVGGLDAVQAESFFDFDYTALGHLHSPQQIKRSTIRYGGSLMKYSLSEAHQKKQIVMVEMKEKGETDVSFLPFVFLHDLRECKGSYDEVMAMGFVDEHKEDYMHITLTDEHPIADAKARLNTVYPNIMELSYDNLRTTQQQIIRSEQERTPLELVNDLYELQNNQPMDEHQITLIRQLLEETEESE